MSRSDRGEGLTTYEYNASLSCDCPADNKEEVAKYAKMSYDTLYSLCHDKGGGMMSVPSVQDVKGEIEEDYIFGVPEKNAVCVAN